MKIKTANKYRRWNGSSRKSSSLSLYSVFHCSRPNAPLIRWNTLYHQLLAVPVHGKTTSIVRHQDRFPLLKINWSEPWLIGLGGFHAVCLLIIVLTRGHLNIQIFIFLALRTWTSLNCSRHAVRLSSLLHLLCWVYQRVRSRKMAVSDSNTSLVRQISPYYCRLFAEDQHFDSQGMFISTVLSLPVIFNCCVLVVSGTRWCVNSKMPASLHSCLDPLVVRIDLVVESVHSKIQEDAHRTGQTSREEQDRVNSDKAISNCFLLPIKRQPIEYNHHWLHRRRIDYAIHSF